MKKYFRILFLLVTFTTLVATLPVAGQAPPPPSHSMNGNQPSPGGTGCPIDRTDGILFALVCALGYAGFVLYQRGQKEKEIS